MNKCQGHLHRQMRLAQTEAQISSGKCTSDFFELARNQSDLKDRIVCLSFERELLRLGLSMLSPPAADQVPQLAH